jgi:hypothetical protein
MPDVSDLDHSTILPQLPFGNLFWSNRNVRHFPVHMMPASNMPRGGAQHILLDNWQSP